MGSIPNEINVDGLEQEELNLVFDKAIEKGFLFDEIIYLTAPQLAFDGISSRRFSHRNTVLDDPLIQNSNLKDIYDELIAKFPEHRLDDEIEFIKEKHPKYLKEYQNLIWRNIQHYPVDEQVKWLTKFSNFKNVYCNELKVVQLNLPSLRDEKKISDVLEKWIRQYFSEKKVSQYIINVSLGSTETQVVWHILAEASRLPEKTRFIKTYDDKSDKPEKRFKRFSIQEIPTNLISSIGSDFTIYSKTESPSRALVNMKMEAFLKSGFSILLIGERGIGKSQIAGKAKLSLDIKSPLVEANCASFEADSKAEAELFGYEKGAFTDAKVPKKGLLEEADNGILFLDEIHHLSKSVQAKLMKALQTDEYNRMSIRRMNSNKEIKVECRLIFATNKSVTQLQELLLPDFYDRIVQHVILIPPLRDTIEDRIRDWESVWKGLKFRGEAPKEPELITWINKQPLLGNYRDLQKIAIYYNSFNHFNNEMKEKIKEKSGFQYAKNEFEKYHSPIMLDSMEKYNFNNKQTTKQMIADYLYELQDWAVKKHRGRKYAIEYFNSKGDTVTEKTFNDWKNRKSIIAAK